MTAPDEAHPPPSSVGSEIVFGLWADRGAAPEHAGGPGGAFDRPVVGPSGFVDLLETALGLSGPPISALDRVVAWQKQLEAAGGDRFWSGSLVADPWATARRTLAWRDDLIGAGWDPNVAYRSRRLHDLAAAERAGDPVPFGVEDRLRAIEEALAAPIREPRFRTVRTIDARDDLPVAWRRVLDRLERSGVQIEVASRSPAAPAATSLGRLQRWLIDPTTPDASGAPDGTVIRASSTSTVQAADVVAHWTATVGADLEAALIAQGDDSHALDEAARRAGAPRFGASAPSPHRGSLQVLRLAFQLAWTPLDVHAAMDLLSLPNAPIAPRAAHRLADALGREPGDSDAWREAWERVESRERERAEGDPDALARVDTDLARWRSWFDVGRADPVEGLPLAAATAVCDRVAEWARKRSHGAQDPLYLATARVASDVRAALMGLGKARIPRVWLDRIVDHATQEGERDPDARAEVGVWPTVAHPGAIWGPVGTVVWWNVRTGADGPADAPWSRSEREELWRHACRPDDGERAARAAAAAWERAVLQARDRIVLVTVGLDAGSDEAAHPLNHRIAPVAARTVQDVDLDDAASLPVMSFAGTTLTREPVERRSLPTVRSSWPTPAALLERLDDRTESVTSLETLLDCQLRWSLRHVARLRSGYRGSIPTPHQLLGNLSHALAAEIVTPGAPPDPKDAARRARETFEGWVDRIAVPLRYDEHAVDLAVARREVPAAIGALARTLAENDLVVEALEHAFEAEPEGGPALRGRVDLIASDRDGRAVIVDLKWSGRSKYRRDQIAAGTAVQLASYAMGVAPGVGARGGFFMLGQQEFLIEARSGLRGSRVVGQRDLHETWRDAADAWRAWNERAREGAVRARGLPRSDEAREDVAMATSDDPCRYCEFVTLCQVARA